MEEVERSESTIHNIHTKITNKGDAVVSMFNYLGENTSRSTTV
jgi:hypothetical protein